MALTALLLVLFVQRWLQFDSYRIQYDWFEHYYVWMKHRFDGVIRWTGMIAAIIVILPAWLLFILFALLIYHLIGIIGYYVLSVAVLWYCLDAHPLNKMSKDRLTPRQMLVIIYQELFAVVFWLLILGVVGVVLYQIVISFRSYLERQTESNEGKKSLLAVVIKIAGVLDWIPSRLIGITYALVSQFAPTFRIWYKNLLSGLNHTTAEAAQVGLVALGLANQPENTATTEQIKLINGLADRSLLVWLVIIALFTIGTWIG